MWKLGKTGPEQRMVLDEADKYVCSVQIHQTPRHMGEYDEHRRLSNVPLILAAPELLNALKVALPYTTGKTWVRVQAAIDVATGEIPDEKDEDGEAQHMQRWGPSSR